MEVTGEQATQCWSCGTHYNNVDEPSWPYCPNCAQPAWEVLSNSQREKITEAHHRLMEAWQEIQTRIETLEEQLELVHNERDNLKNLIEEQKSRHQNGQGDASKLTMSYVADVEAEQEFYRKSYEELRDWMSELVDERDRAVMERNYYRESQDGLHQKIVDLTTERDQLAWERDHYQEDHARQRAAAAALTEERDKALAEREHYKQRYLQLRDEMDALRGQQSHPPSTTPVTNGHVRPEALQRGDRVQASTGHWATVMVRPLQILREEWRVGVVLDDGGFYIQLPLDFLGKA